MVLHDANEVQKVKQPIIWGKVIGILVCHLLAMFGLLTLPFIHIRWQTCLWGKNPSLCPFWCTSELPAVQAMFLQLFRKNVQVLSMHMQPFVTDLGSCCNKVGSSHYACIVQLVPAVLHRWLHNVVSFTKYEISHSCGWSYARRSGVLVHALVQ